MKQNSIERLANKWLNEPGFRAKMQSDPKGTVKACGISLNTEEWATVKNVVMTTSDEALKRRVSKGFSKN